MIKKSDLRSEFERIVKAKKPVCVGWLKHPFSPETYELRITQSNSSYYVVLIAVAHPVVGGTSYYVRVCVASSYPFRSYKSAYQTLVRL